MSIHTREPRLDYDTSVTGKVLDAEERFAARSAVHGTVVGVETVADNVGIDQVDTEAPRSINATSSDSRRGRIAGVAVAGIAVAGIFVPQVVNNVRSFFSNETPVAAAPAQPGYTQRTDSEGYIAVHQPAACTETLASLGATTLTGAAQVLDQRYQNGQAEGSLEALRNDMSDQLKRAGLSGSDISRDTAETFEFELAQGFCVPEADKPENFGANPIGE